MKFRHDAPVARPMRPDRRFTTWFMTGTWAWLTVKPGSRPRRVVRRILTGLAEWITRYPRLAAFLRQFLARFPRFRDRLRIGFRNERARRLQYVPDALLVASATIAEPDLKDEVEGVRDLYRRLVSLRRQPPGEAPTV